MKNSYLINAKKLMMLLAGTVMTITCANAQSPRHPQIGGDYCTGGDHQPEFGGSTFEIFQTQNSGRDACMTVHRNPARRGDLRREYLAGSWSEIDNALIRESQRPSDTNRSMSYFININSRNNVYHGGYGWWSRNGAGNDDIVEFYVVEGWNDRENPIFGMDYIRSYSSGGNMYDLYVQENITAGTVFGTRTFTQIKCVRQGTTRRANREQGGDNSGFVGNGRFGGTIIWETHFRQMERAGYTPQDIFEVSYTVEGFGRSSEATFLLNATFTNTRRRFNFGQKSLNQTVATVANNEDVTVYPNPTSGAFTVNTNDISEESLVQIYGVNGILISESQSTDASVTMNSQSNLSPGIYLVKVTNSENNSTHKLVVQ